MKKVKAALFILCCGFVFICYYVFTNKYTTLSLSNHVYKFEIYRIEHKLNYESNNLNPNIIESRRKEDIQELISIINKLRLRRVKKEQNTRDDDYIGVIFCCDEKGVFYHINVTGRYLYFHPKGYDSEYTSFYIIDKTQYEELINFLNNIETGDGSLSHCYEGGTGDGSLSPADAPSNLPALKGRETKCLHFVGG